MNSKRIVSMIGAAVVAASMALSSLPVCAAVTTMSDGGKFDAAYYAATYPDVVAALGTNANVLYQHYKTFGVKEGRLPYAAGTAAAATAAQAATATGTLTATEKANAQLILNQYMTEQRHWGVMAGYYYNGGPYKAEYAENPRFGIADLNKDGAYELYTYGGDGVWDVYYLQTTPGEYANAQVSGYNAALNMFDCDAGLVTDYYTLDGQKCIIYSTDRQDVNSVNSEFGYPEYNWIYQYMDKKTYKAVEAATFQSIDKLIQTKALTPANVNAIK